MRRRGIACLRAWLLGAAVIFTPGGVLTAQAEIVAARYAQPTERYGHKVLGAEGEYETLVVTLRNGLEIKAHWPAQIVFEDLAPRLADLDGDGEPEVIVVQSHESFGAQVAIYRLRNNALERAGANAFIGTRFRWLAIVGAADFDGDGHMEIAYIDRPHLAKILRVLRVKIDKQKLTLTQIASLPGLTNHRIGEDFISSGIRDCGQGPEIITANANWRYLQATVLAENKLTTRRIGSFSQSKRAAALSCQ